MLDRRDGLRVTPPRLGPVSIRCEERLALPPLPIVRQRRTGLWSGGLDDRVDPEEVGNPLLLGLRAPDHVLESDRQYSAAAERCQCSLSSSHVASPTSGCSDEVPLTPRNIHE